MNTEYSKLVVILTLGFGSLLIGLLPAALSRFNLRRNLLLQTVLLCFGAGILLATALVHMLPEVREDLGSGIAEVVFCIGFLIVYLADELLHYCCGEAIQHQHAHTPDENQPILPSHHHSAHSSYGSTGEVPEHQHTDGSQMTKAGTSTCEEHQNQHDQEDETINARICHTNHQEPCQQTIAGIIGLLTALSIHALLEGLAIGIQDTTAKVMILFTAVISHKLVVAFCLGVELTASQGSKLKHHFMAIFVFSFGSVIGILIGMGLVDLNSVSQSKFLPVLQGIAGGTLLYVTLCEILPREKAHWHQNKSSKAAGLTQFVAFSTGFAIMTLMNMYISDGD